MIGLLVFLLAVEPVHLKVDQRWSLARYGVERAQAFAVSERGIIAILDRDEKQIVFIDAQGEFIRRSGRKGQGPGEFAYTPEIRWNARDSVFSVYDEIYNKLSHWDEGGNLEGETKVPRHRWMENLRYLPGAGDVVFAKFIMGYDKQTPTLIRHNTDRNQSTVLWQYPMAKPRTGTADTKMGPFGMVNDFHSRLLFGLGSDFLAVNFSAEDRIHRLDLDGKPMGKPFSAGLPAWPVTETLIEDWLSEHEPFVRRMVTRKNLNLPEFYPPIRKLMVDQADRIWVFGFPRNMTGPTPYKVFSSKGKPLAVGKLPQMAQVFVNNQLFFLSEEEDGPVLVRTVYQVPEPK